MTSIAITDIICDRQENVEFLLLFFYINVSGRMNEMDGNITYFHLLSHWLLCKKMIDERSGIFNRTTDEKVKQNTTTLSYVPPVFYSADLLGYGLTYDKKEVSEM